MLGAASLSLTLHSNGAFADCRLLLQLALARLEGEVAAPVNIAFRAALAWAPRALCVGYLPVFPGLQVGFAS